MSWIRIRICISPYVSGSDFYYTYPDPQIRIRIRITWSKWGDFLGWDFSQFGGMKEGKWGSKWGEFLVWELPVNRHRNSWPLTVTKILWRNYNDVIVEVRLPAVNLKWYFRESLYYLLILFLTVWLFPCKQFSTVSRSIGGRKDM